jgi:hypothetical protein
VGCVAMDVEGREEFTVSRGLYETNTRSPWLVTQWLVVTLGIVREHIACSPEAKGF